MGKRGRDDELLAKLRAERDPRKGYHRLDRVRVEPIRGQHDELVAGLDDPDDITENEAD